MSCSRVQRNLWFATVPEGNFDKKGDMYYSINDYESKPEVRAALTSDRYLHLFKTPKYLNAKKEADAAWKKTLKQRTNGASVFRFGHGSSCLCLISCVEDSGSWSLMTRARLGGVSVHMPCLNQTEILSMCIAWEG